MTVYVNDAGTWRTINSMFVNDGGTWRSVNTGYIYDGGAWRTFLTSGLTYTSSIPGAPGTLTAATPLTFTGSGGTGVSHTITFSNPGTIQVKGWGAGGGDYGGGDGGAGGSFTSLINVVGGTTYRVFAGGTGAPAPNGSRRGSGAGAASGFLLAPTNGEIAVAGGGGGSCGGGRYGGPGGGPAGSPAPGGGGQGGTQSGAGAGGSSSRRTGQPGQGTNGGQGNTGGVTQPGGTSGVPGLYNGGGGADNPGDQGSGGGGGGRFAGGEGGGDAGGFGGGGGSGYFNPPFGSATLFSGSYPSIAGNPSDPQRGTAGQSTQAGRIVINAV